MIPHGDDAAAIEPVGGHGAMDGSARGAELADLTAVHEATRALFSVRNAADARLIAEGLVQELGGTLEPASTADATALPIDVSFGDGEPVLPVAPPGPVRRRRLEQHLVDFVIDARRALELAGRTERLAEAASIDTLTGVANRRMLGRALGRLAPGETVILLDLDHFKQVNDQFGHAAGDEVLRALGAVLVSTIRAYDFVGRFGGEEFVVIVRNGSADRLLQRLRAKWSESRPRPVTFSAGVAECFGDAKDALERADEALYRAKAAGRDRWIHAGADQVTGDVEK